MTNTPNLPAAFMFISLALVLIFFCISKLRKINKEIESRPKRKVFFVNQKPKNNSEEAFKGFLLIGSISLVWAFILAPLSPLTLLFSGIFWTIVIIGAFSTAK